MAAADLRRLPGGSAHCPSGGVVAGFFALGEYPGGGFAACVFHDLENYPVFMAAGDKNFRKFAEI
jgi:hypothetical protein